MDLQAKMGNVILRPYQAEIVHNTITYIREQWQQKKPFEPAFINAFVASGKTLVMGGIAHYASSKNANVMILSRQGELAEQNSEECFNMGVANSVYSASLGKKQVMHNVIVGTEKTVANALNTDFANWVPHILCVDESHMICTEDAVLDNPKTQYGKIIKHFRIKRPNLAIIGLTGSPFRGTVPIITQFWRKIIEPQIDMQWLVENSFIVPTIYGYSGLEYKLDEFNKMDELGTGDFSSSQLSAMDEKMDTSLTHEIMREVVAITQDRLGVLVTCASLKHCKEAAAILPEGSYGIVTDKTPEKERRQILDDAKQLKIKFVFQIGCLTTGVNVPLWDTSVILRRIGSLTLLTQLLGRGMRLLKPEHEEAGYHKRDHLCLDYSGTMHQMAQMFENPMLDAAELQRGKKTGELKECPRCGTENGEYARRCVGADLASNDGRCEHFWQSKTCPECGTLNDTTARDCRNPECRHTLIDPNKALMNKHYTEGDLLKVQSMDLQPTKNGGILVKYKLLNEKTKEQVSANLFFNPWASDGAKHIWKTKFVYQHIKAWQWRNKVMAASSVEAVLKMKPMFDVPLYATYRLNEKNMPIIHGVKFRTRTLMGGKEV